VHCDRIWSQPETNGLKRRQSTVSTDTFGTLRSLAGGACVT